jgi:oxygen-independent coproporphyrinogen-3 oxidase
VPFCAQLCWYCGCHTKIVNSYYPIGEYARLLLHEIALVADRIPFRAPVSHIHFGGGTPTMLANADFAKIMDAIRALFAVASDAEIAVEIDPRTCDARKAEALADAGVKRASLGVQDLGPTVQQAVNRIQPPEVTERVVHDLRAFGITKINIDLIYGLPHQTVEGVVGTVDRVATLAPDRLAVFGYAHVPWMKSHQKLIDERALPDGPARMKLSQAIAWRLVGHGYRRIGLDHFARPDDGLARALDAGRLRRNFQGYTDDRAEVLLGFGASAIGDLPQGYVQNATPFRDYREAIQDLRPAVVRGIALDDDDRRRRAVIERLMCDLFVDLTAIEDEHGPDPDGFADELAALEPLIDDGLVAVDGRCVRVSELGQPFVRTVAAFFDRYLHTGRARHSRAV